MAAGTKTGALIQQRAVPEGLATSGGEPVDRGADQDEACALAGIAAAGLVGDTG